MEARLISITEGVLTAALEFVKLSNGDPETLLVYAGQGIDTARDQICNAAFDHEDAGEAYYGLACMALVACAAHHELKGT